MVKMLNEALPGEADPAIVEERRQQPYIARESESNVMGLSMLYQSEGRAAVCRAISVQPRRAWLIVLCTPDKHEWMIHKGCQ